MSPSNLKNASDIVGAVHNALTSEYKINYIKPAKGQRLICESIAESCGSKQAVCTARVFSIDGDEKILCAIAQGTVIKSP